MEQLSRPIYNGKGKEDKAFRKENDGSGKEILVLTNAKAHHRHSIYQ